jgi:ketosteroid isomerase-like protein
MSRDNVEVVRRGFDAFNRSDYEGAMALFDPDVEWHPYLGAVEGSIYRGRASLLQMWNELNENLGGSLSFEVKELIARGDRVVSVVEAHGVGTASGAEVHQSWAQVITLRDGLIYRVEPFLDKAAALEAAGLSE